MKRTATTSEKCHMARIAGMGCIVCELCLDAPGTLAQVHHVRVNHGWGRSGHMNTIPLCMEHHTGNTGIHLLGRELFASLYGYSEQELLAIVNERIQKK